MESKTRQILQRIFDELKEIKTFNGYHVDVEKVTFKLISPEELKEKTLISIIAGDAPLTRLVGKAYTSGGHEMSLDGWRISINIYLKTDQDDSGVGLNGLEIEDFMADVINCLGNIDWSDLPFVKIVTLLSVYRHPGYAENVLVNQLVIMVKYDFIESEA